MYLPTSRLRLRLGLDGFARGTAYRWPADIGEETWWPISPHAGDGREAHRSSWTAHYPGSCPPESAHVFRPARSWPIVSIVTRRKNSLRRWHSSDGTMFKRRRRPKTFPFDEIALPELFGYWKPAGSSHGHQNAYPANIAAIAGNEWRVLPGAKSPDLAQLLSHRRRRRHWCRENR